MIKVLIAVVFLAMLTSLLVGAGFLLRDDSRSRRLLASLKVRVTLAVVLVALLVYGFYFGGLASSA
ncbi:DUF2909 domain-containing protein [Halomonas sp. McH1-25]|uniref:DUF2909 family protein n=1 Tax=unclassified Halomonas TaxID=2609666 RepID=UPI001EF7068B|nr:MULTISPECIES: DUF2909 family protein [unclassified Halomonas]MCG7598561.1 DUF2909 domain-containing protein [Halomonas sp. McH1-25]MCP1341813.1 DUF2909 domain-containing protein [Halomonas sp. FL8]MCP1362963.1 DUF2909 domain-containing protein [Halomonas sp. BBD45]MCP1364654.1 DUF2909 domain-containing protein [Halomonas sp. BBD48]